MSEKRFRFEKEYTKNFFTEKGVFYDNERPMSANEIIALLNSLNEDNEQLKGDNEQLKKRNNFLEEFDGRAKTVANLKEENEQLRTQLLICQQSKKDDGRFQVWEVPPIPMGRRISFTTNNDGDGV